MQTQKLFYLISLVVLFLHGTASKVVTVADGDWDEAPVWSGGSVPSNPDTLIIKHYLTFSHDLVINAPTTVIIEENATLCGDFFLDISCGARIINYGRLYINKADIRDGVNYFEFYAKSQITIKGCSLPGYGTGYLNSPPYGHTFVWPPVLCKTSHTHWPREAFVGVSEHRSNPSVSVYPNPVNSGPLTIKGENSLEYSLSDIYGRVLYTDSGLRSYEIKMETRPAGIYFLRVKEGQTSTVYKIIKE